MGTPTLPAIYYGEANPEDEVLAASLEGNASDAELDALIQRINESGVIQQAMDEARECAEKAVESLAEFPEGKEKNSLEELGSYIVDRDL
jgi:geranylgeranyl pyrophosphate synthase